MSHEFYGQFWPVDPIQWSSGKKDVTEPAEFNIRIQTKPDLNHTMAYNSSGVPQETFFTTKFNIVIAPKPGYTLKQAKDAAYKYVQSMTDRNVFTEFWFDSTYLYNIVKILDFSTSSENWDVYNGLSGTIDVVMSSLRFRDIKMVTGNKALDTINLRDGVELNGDEYRTVQLYGNVMAPDLDYTRDTNYTREPLQFDNTTDTAPLVTTDPQEENKSKLKNLVNKNSKKVTKNDPSDYGPRMRVWMGGIPVTLEDHKYYINDNFYVRPAVRGVLHEDSKISKNNFVEHKSITKYSNNNLSDFVAGYAKFYKMREDATIYEPEAWEGFYANVKGRQTFGEVAYYPGVPQHGTTNQHAKFEIRSYIDASGNTKNFKQPVLGDPDMLGFQAHIYPVEDITQVLTHLFKINMQRYWEYPEFWYNGFDISYGSTKNFWIWPGGKNDSSKYVGDLGVDIRDSAWPSDPSKLWTNQYLGTPYTGRFNTQDKESEYYNEFAAEMSKQIIPYSGKKYRVHGWIPEWKTLLWTSQPWQGEFALKNKSEEDPDDSSTDPTDPSSDNQDDKTKNYEYVLTVYDDVYTLDPYTKYNGKQINYLEQPDAIEMVKGLVNQGRMDKEMFKDYTIPYGYDLAQLKELFREVGVALDVKVEVDKPISTPKTAEDLSKSQLVVSPHYLKNAEDKYRVLAGQDVTEFKKEDAKVLAELANLDFSRYNKGFDFALLRDKLVDMGVLEYVVPGTYVDDGLEGDFEVLDEYPEDIYVDELDQDEDGVSPLKLRFTRTYVNPTYTSDFFEMMRVYDSEYKIVKNVDYAFAMDLRKLPGNYYRNLMIGMGDYYFKIGNPELDRYIRWSSPRTIENDLVSLGYLYRVDEFKTIWPGTYEYDLYMRKIEEKNNWMEKHKEWQQKRVEENDKLFPPKEDPLDEEDVVVPENVLNFGKDYPNEDTEWGKKLKELIEKGTNKATEEIQHSGNGYVASAYLPAYTDPSVQNPPKVLSQTLLSINNTFSMSNIGSINIDRYRNIYVDQRYSNKLLGIYPWIPSSDHMPQIHTIVSAVYTEVV